MISFEKEEPTSEEQEMQKRFEEEVKKLEEAGYSGRPSQGALDLMEGFARLRAESIANAHKFVIRL